MLGKHKGDPNFDPSARSQTGARNGQTVRGYYPGLGIVVVNSQPPTQAKGDSGGSGTDVEHKTATEFARKGMAPAGPSVIRDPRERVDEDGEENPRQQRPTRSTPGFGKATVETDR